MKELRPLMEKHGFSFSKTLGQNFLINPDVPVRIAENAGLDENTTVIEIGPGVGCLTKELSARAKEVFAIEIDQRLIPVLAETLADCDNVTVINEDVLKTDLSALCEGKERVCVCANLPYYITTPIIMALLEQRLPLSRITVMIQKEVAQRFSAKPGKKEYGAITAAINWYARPKTLFTVSPGCFMPAPKVESSVIALDLVPPPVEVKDEKFMFLLISAGFEQRRKTLVNALSAKTGIPKTEIEKAVTDCGFEPTVRAERLSVTDFAALSDRLITQ